MDTEFANIVAVEVDVKMDIQEQERVVEPGHRLLSSATLGHSSCARTNKDVDFANIMAGEVGGKMEMQEQMEVLEQRENNTLESPISSTSRNILKRKPAPLLTVKKRDIVRDSLVHTRLRNFVNQLWGEVPRSWWWGRQCQQHQREGKVWA